MSKIQATAEITENEFDVPSGNQLVVLRSVKQDSDGNPTFQLSIALAPNHPVATVLTVGATVILTFDVQPGVVLAPPVPVHVAEPAPAPVMPFPLVVAPTVPPVPPVPTVEKSPILAAAIKGAEDLRRQLGQTPLRDESKDKIPLGTIILTPTPRP